MTPEDFELYAEELLARHTPDELFDFLDSQGAFDRLKNPKLEDDELFVRCDDPLIVESLNNGS